MTRTRSRSLVRMVDISETCPPGEGVLLRNAYR